MEQVWQLILWKCDRAGKRNWQIWDRCWDGEMGKQKASWITLGIKKYHFFHCKLPRFCWNNVTIYVKLEAFEKQSRRFNLWVYNSMFHVSYEIKTWTFSEMNGIKSEQKCPNTWEIKWWTDEGKKGVKRLWSGQDERVVPYTGGNSPIVDTFVVSQSNTVKVQLKF